LLTAIVRQVSESIDRCELSYIERRPIEYGKTLSQHQLYIKTLAEGGARIVELPADNKYPDAVFVEDSAVVTADRAVITRMGAASRRGEEEAVRMELARIREISSIEEPGTLDGGDVMRVGDSFFVGTSGRTNRSGFDQLQNLMGKSGFSVEALEPRGCLHLKSACTFVADRYLLINPDWIDGSRFAGVEILEISPREPWAANTLSIGDRVICSASYPETNALLRDKGLSICEIDVDEFHKAEGALTCMSILLED